MPETGAAAAQRYREGLRSKAERLGGGEDARNVDASDFTPGEPLNTEAKTGMRPVSRQARKRGGAVTGAHAKATPGRRARKNGGGIGISFANRDQKAANEDRAGVKHDMGLKKGGRAHRAVGGPGEARAIGVGGPGGSPGITLGGTARQPKKMGFAGAGQGRAHLGRHSVDTLHALAESETDPSRLSHIFDEIDRRSGRRRGGRASKAGGGGLGALGGLLPLAVQAVEGGGGSGNPLGPTAAAAGRASGGGVYKPDIERKGASMTRDLKRRSASSTVETRMGRASGGRVARADGGPLATPLAAGMGGQGRFGFNFPGNRSQAVGLKDGGRAKARSRYGSAGPATHHPGMAKADGGRAGFANGGKTPEYFPGSKVRVPSDEEQDRWDAQRAARRAGKAPEYTDEDRARRRPPARAKGGEVAEGALKQHRKEHKAMGAGEHPKGCTCPKCKGGEVKARARGGKTGKGKMSVNIVIAPGGAAGAGDGTPPGMNPQLAIKPPTPAMPMPMPGGPPGAPPPMPMPMPVPMGAGAPPGMPPPGMPPRARGGRAPQMEAGAGSGLGRLEKTRKYGKRSHEQEGSRP